MTRAMLLCAGLGTRLRPLSDGCPKPMLPVCNLPIVRYGIALLVGHGIRDIVINLHHRGEVIERALGDGAAFGARIRYLYESTILGTGGGLKNAAAMLDPEGRDEPFVSLNGKLIFDVDLGAVLAAYAAAPESLGMMVVRPIPQHEQGLWGAVEVDTQAALPRVKNILGPGGHMFAGVHVTRPSVVRRLPEGEACMVRQGYLPWLRQGAPVHAFIAPWARYFAEHSTPHRYLKSNLAVLAGAGLRYPPGASASANANPSASASASVSTGADGAADAVAGGHGQAGPGIAASARVHPSAVITAPVCIGAEAEIGADARVGPDAVVGPGAVIAPGAQVERSVVWAGARVSGAHRDRIITPNAMVDAASDAPALA